MARKSTRAAGARAVGPSAALLPRICSRLLELRRCDDRARTTRAGKTRRRPSLLHKCVQGLHAGPGAGTCAGGRSGLPRQRRAAGRRNARLPPQPSRQSLSLHARSRQPRARQRPLAIGANSRRAGAAPVRSPGDADAPAGPGNVDSSGRACGPAAAPASHAERPGGATRDASAPWHRRRRP